VSLIRGLNAIAARPMERKYHMRNGVLVDDTPAPGRHYVKAAKGEGHAYSWPPVGRGRGESIYSPRRIEAMLKAREAFDMYYEYGLTWSEVAAKLGYASRSGPWMAVRRMTTRNDHNSGYFKGRR
jgi:hypothetical protein